MFDINNRRYTGSKAKLIDWIKNTIEEHCEGKIFLDLFAGTGIITEAMLNNFNEVYINDFLYSNEVIYNAFFSQEDYDIKKIEELKNKYCSINEKQLIDNYVSDNYGDKFFNMEDAKLIGFIREDIEKNYKEKIINIKEYNILLASLLYSLDKIANTVGHYDAYRKIKNIKKAFSFNLIKPLKIDDKKIKIFREDANNLVRKIKSDIVFIDPPYNSRQYSRFYHVLENITKWDKPELYGVAMKPKKENMSDYCRKAAPEIFKDLIDNIKTNYIVVTYNNNYNGKSSSSRNKIKLEEIEEILNTRGTTKIYSKSHNFFNAGKTEFDDHKELIFITEVS